MRAQCVSADTSHTTTWMMIIISKKGGGLYGRAVAGGGKWQPRKENGL